VNVTNTRAKVFYLRGKGCKPSEIASQLGISKQRVYQILAGPRVLKPRKPGRKPSPPEDRKRKLPSREVFRADQVPEMEAILRERDSWTWAEADAALRTQELKPPAAMINRFLRELGFVFDRRKKRWIRSQTLG
jgi:transposase